MKMEYNISGMAVCVAAFGVSSRYILDVIREVFQEPCRGGRDSKGS